MARIFSRQIQSCQSAGVFYFRQAVKQWQAVAALTSGADPAFPESLIARSRTERDAGQTVGEKSKAIQAFRSLKNSC
jgi:hypothetical protein